MPLQLRDIVEGIGAVESACVDEAHEGVADARSGVRLVEERVFPVEDRFLQSSLSDVVVQRSAGLSEE